MRTRRAHRIGASLHVDTIALLSAVGGLAWASGFRLYLVIFLAGLLSRLGFLPLPGDLHLLQHEYVLVASASMACVEFLADKIPLVDSVWDAVHTFIRIPAAAVLTGAAVGADSTAVTLAAAILGGTIATGAHLTKAGTRAVINASPEPFSNWAASFTEDGMVLGGLWLALAFPWVFLLLLAAFLGLAVWLVPKLWRGVRALFRRLAGRARTTVPPGEGA
jgi:hypothetical protein